MHRTILLLEPEPETEPVWLISMHWWKPLTLLEVSPILGQSTLAQVEWLALSVLLADGSNATSETNLSLTDSPSALDINQAPAQYSFAFDSLTFLDAAEVTKDETSAEQLPASDADQSTTGSSQSMEIYQEDAPEVVVFSSWHVVCEMEIPLPKQLNSLARTTQLQAIQSEHFNANDVPAHSWSILDQL